MALLQCPLNSVTLNVEAVFSSKTSQYLTATRCRVQKKAVSLWKGFAHTRTQKHDHYN